MKISRFFLAYVLRRQTIQFCVDPAAHGDSHRVLGEKYYKRKNKISRMCRQWLCHYYTKIVGNAFGIRSRILGSTDMKWSFAQFAHTQTRLPYYAIVLESAHRKTHNLNLIYVLFSQSNIQTSKERMNKRRLASPGSWIKTIVRRGIIACIFRHSVGHRNRAPE